jgi:hypothetical protein
MWMYFCLSLVSAYNIIFPYLCKLYWKVKGRFVNIGPSKMEMDQIVI